MMLTHYVTSAGYRALQERTDALAQMNAPAAARQHHAALLEAAVQVPACPNGWHTFPTCFDADTAEKPLAHKLYLPEDSCLTEDQLDDMLRLLRSLPEECAYLQLDDCFVYCVLPPQKLGRNINDLIAAAAQALANLPDEVLLHPCNNGRFDVLRLHWGSLMAKYALEAPVVDGLPDPAELDHAIDRLRHKANHPTVQLIAVPRQHLDSLPADEPYLLPEDRIDWSPLYGKTPALYTEF